MNTNVVVLNDLLLDASKVHKAGKKNNSGKGEIRVKYRIVLHLFMKRIFILF